MFRKIIIPESANISLLLPENFIGKQVEVIAFKVDDEKINEQKSDEDKYAWKNAKDFFDAHRIDLSHFEFNREEANER